VFLYSKNHDYVILCGARRKEQRWDPKDNEQIVPEGKIKINLFIADKWLKWYTIYVTMEMLMKTVDTKGRCSILYLGTKFW